MAEEMIEFQKPEDLCKWLQTNNSDVQVDESEAELLLRYMEGHDYQLGFDKNKMLRQDVAEENGERVSYSIDEVIDIVCEWNYELLEHAANGMANPKDFIDFCNYKDAYDLLKEDEVFLDRMFARTLYGRVVEKKVETIIMEAGFALEDRTKEPLHHIEKNDGKESVQERVR